MGITTSQPRVRVKLMGMNSPFGPSFTVLVDSARLPELAALVSEDLPVATVFEIGFADKEFADELPWEERVYYVGPVLEVRATRV